MNRLLFFVDELWRLQTLLLRGLQWHLHFLTPQVSFHASNRRNLACGRVVSGVASGRTCKRVIRSFALCESMRSSSVLRSGETTRAIIYSPMCLFCQPRPLTKTKTDSFGTTSSEGSSADMQRMKQSRQKEGFSSRYAFPACVSAMNANVE